MFNEFFEELARSWYSTKGTHKEHIIECIDEDFEDEDEDMILYELRNLRNLDLSNEDKQNIIEYGLEKIRYLLIKNS